MPFLDKLKNILKEHEPFLLSEGDAKVAKSILDEVGRFMLLDGREINLDTEQEREQEQEQQKEVQVRARLRARVRYSRVSYVSRSCA